MASSAVTLEQVTKSFGERIAVEKLSLNCERGQIFGFLGPNGAGKTTTIKMLLGRLAPDSGRVSVLGEDPSKQGVQLRERIGAVLDQVAIYPRLTVESNLLFYGRLYPSLAGGELDARLEEVLELVGLTPRRKEPAGSLSLGLKKRLALARALLAKPELLLLDEPTSGLDPNAALDFRSLIRDFKESGGSVFLTTHLMAEAEELCDDVAILQSGKLLCCGSPEELMNEHLQPNEPRRLEGVFHRVTEASD